VERSCAITSDLCKFVALKDNLMKYNNDKYNTNVKKIVILIFIINLMRLYLLYF